MIKKILIIDDEEDICFLLKAMLRKKADHLDYANTISEGLIKVQEMQPDVLFLDINLPDGSGLDTIHKVKALSLNTKIIMISAYDGPAERERAKLEGAEGFISKPFNQEMINQGLQGVVSPA